jgi:hypothetical protein
MHTLVPSFVEIDLVFISRIHNQSLKSLLKPLDYNFTHSFQVVRSHWQCALLSSSTGTSSSALKIHRGRGAELLFEPTFSDTRVQRRGIDCYQPHTHN